jgi:hypothetical protein
MKSIFIILPVFFFLLVSVSAQDGYTVKQDSLQSEILKQNRKISIFLPEGYDTIAFRFIEDNKNPKPIPMTKEMLFYKE